MSKPIEFTLLLPGALGWELWKRNAEGAYERTSSDDGPMLAGEIAGLPSGDVAMLFPVRSLQALPFKAGSGDEDLFDDLAVMHAERMGIRPDPMAGQLSDTIVVERSGEDAVLLHVVLENPREGEMPARTPQEFDISPRAFPVKGDEVCVWKELGKWVFALHSGGKLIYCQATSSSDEAPGADVLREIRLAVGQLQLQGLHVRPSLCRVWSPQAELGEAGALDGQFPHGVVVERRPDPVMPDPPSRLLPADVRAARRQRQKRNQVMGLVALVALVYLGFIGWSAFGLWQDISERNKLSKQAEGVSGVSEEFQVHQAKWDELGPVVDSTRNPLEIMLEIQKSIPRNSGLRLKTADINLAENSIKLLGNAPQSGPVNTFSLALKRNPTLSSWLEWDNQPATKKKDEWEFVFSAAPSQ